MKHRLLIGAIAVTAGLAGCAVGPDYQRPAALAGRPLPAQFTDVPATNNFTGGWKIAEPSAQLPRGDWWQIFGDAELNRLEALASTNNQNLAAMADRYAEARALATAT